MNSVASESDPVVAVVIATRNRPDHLAHVINGLSEQTLRPAVIVVCDSSDPGHAVATAEVVNRSSLESRLVHSSIRSLTVQKNTALDELQDRWDIEFIQILDDDTVPDAMHLETLAATLRENPAAVGASGVTTPRWEPLDKGPVGNLIVRICGLGSNRPGSVTAAGVGIPVKTWLPEVQAAEWLFGCSMWRAWIFSKERYLPDFVGSGLGEDVEFSTRASRYGELIVNPRAILDHASASEGRPDSYMEAYRFVRNRRRVARNVQSWKTSPTFVLSVGVVLASRLVKGRKGFPAAKGTLHGVVDEMRHRPLR